MATNANGLCEECFYRQDSRRRVDEYVQMRLGRGEKPPFSGPVCDPAPRTECKRHEGYGYEVETKTLCHDFRPIEATAA